MVRTPNPACGTDALWFMQIADTAKSDLGLAGMALRCREAGVEVPIVPVGALPLNLHPKVEINAAGNPENLPPSCGRVRPCSCHPLPRSSPWGLWKPLRN